MEIKFKNNTLKKNYENHSKATKAYGEIVGRKYIQRISIISEAIDITELSSIRTLRCHQLSGDRTGEWAIKLTGQMRLIFTLKGNNLEIARIEEVSKHYD